MSMTVKIRMKELTSLALLLDAFREMGKTAFSVTDGSIRVQGRPVLAIANIDGNKVGIQRNKTGELVMVGDNEWSCMSDERLQETILQQYTVAAVKRKVTELRYNIASIDTLEDGSIRLVARAWG